MTKSLNILHFAGFSRIERFWSPLFIENLSSFGKITIHEDTDAWSDERVVETGRTADVIITSWGSRRLPDALAENPGRLKYVCNLTGEVRPFVSRRFVESGILLTNWGNIPAFGVAEGALTLLLASIKELLPTHYLFREDTSEKGRNPFRGTVRGLHAGIYGMGVIGRAFVDLVQPLQPVLYGFDPYAEEWPQGVERKTSLAALFDASEAVIVCAAMTPDTRHTVNADMLSRLPEAGIVVNVARGGIIEQKALFRELESGRLRAALDVLDTDGKDSIPAGHPGRRWPNLILTGHRVSNSRWNEGLHPDTRLLPHQELALENLQRFVSGEPLLFAFDPARYDRST